MGWGIKNPRRHTDDDSLLGQGHRLMDMGNNGDPFFDDMGQFEEALHRMPDTKIPMDKPAPTHFVNMVEVQATKFVASADYDAVVKMVTVDQEGIAHVLIFSAMQASMTGSQLIYAAGDALGQEPDAPEGMTFEWEDTNE
jgi:hypothetical protein